MGDGDMMRAGRMLAQGDLRLLALALIAEQPRHGYEIIKVLEEKTEGWYAPSPGIVYPTLTYLEEAGYVTAEASRRKEALHHHRRRPRLSRGQPRPSSMRCWSDSQPSASAPAGCAAAPKATSATTDGRGCRAWCGPRSTICARSRPNDLRGDADAEAKVVEALARAAAELKRS